MTGVSGDSRGSALILVRAFLDADQLAAARDYLTRLDAAQRRSMEAVELEVELLLKESQLSEALEFAAQVEETLPDSPRLRAILTLTRARVDFMRGEVRGAHERLSGVLATSTGALDAKLLSDVYSWLANCCYFERDIEEARRHLESALAHAESTNYAAGLIQGLAGLARCERSLGHWDRAFALLERALEEAGQSQHRKLLQNVTSNLAVGKLFAGQFISARRLLRSYLALALENKDAVNLPLAYAAMGLLHTRTREWKLARQHLLTAHRLAERGHLARPLALSCEYLGELALAEGRRPRAKRWLRQAIRIAEPAGLRDVVGEASCRLAEVELMEGDADAALARAKQCLTDFESMHDFYEVAVSRRVVGQILLALGRRVEALDELDRALSAFQSLSEQFESRRVAYLQEAAARGEVVLDIREALRDVEGGGRTESGDRESVEGSGTADVGLIDEGQGAGSVRPAEPSDTRSSAEDPETPPVRRGKRASAATHSEPNHHPDFPELLGRSSLLVAVLDQAKTFARSEAPVLLEGETGTGKELLARAIHRLSARGKGPFVPLNCGTSTPEMLDSELFGHERGAFTGAAATRAGLARKAHLGSLFLDEIAELPSPAQPRLLRLVDSGELRSVGSDEFESVDLRLLSATHQDLAAAAAAGRFREDLLFRLSTFRLRLPALRHRLEDLPILVVHFAEEARRRGYPEFAGVSSKVLDQMALHSWPGNLRELRNVIFRLAGSAQPGRLVTEWTRPQEPGDTRGRVLDRATVVSVIKEAHGNLTAAARRLGVSRGRLYRDLARWGIDPTDLRG